MKQIEEEINDYEDLQRILSDEELDLHMGKDKQSYIDAETYIVISSLSDKQYKEYIK